MTKQDLWNWFYNSASIMWSRLQVLLGCIVLVITTTDMSPWLPVKYLPIWIVVNGVITEYLRRSNASTNTIRVSDQQGVVSQVTYLQAASPIPEGSKLVKKGG